MSICKQLIELMGGTIQVESEKGMGTTITFTVQFVKGSQENIPTREAVHIDAAMLKGKRILVVDDNEMNRIVATTILNNYQADTIEAGNGREAMDLLRREHPDLILMDVQMPILDGIEATRIIRREISQTIPIIALTANAIKGDNDKCIDAGMNDYISKPFKEEELVKSITRWLGNADWTPTATETETMVSTKPYDLAGIRNISRGNDAFVGKLVRLFMDQTPPIVSEIMERFEAGDLATMGALAHKLKPSIDNLGIVDLKETIREIERAGKSATGNEKLPAHLQQLNNIMHIVVEELQKEFPA
jgi:CheY-like chemotaxis protein/HPt (histidine-containing phosphotransfer) domain-containing protein